MYLDFAEKLNEYINSLNYGIPSLIGLLETTESISLYPMPGGDETLFNDGSRDKVLNFDINIKIDSKKPGRMKFGIDTLNNLSRLLSQLSELESDNGSYEFVQIEVNSYPSHVTTDDNEFVIYSISIAATIYIPKGVIY